MSDADVADVADVAAQLEERVQDATARRLRELGYIIIKQDDLPMRLRELGYRLISDETTIKLSELATEGRAYYEPCEHISYKACPDCQYLRLVDWADKVIDALEVVVK